MKSEKMFESILTCLHAKCETYVYQNYREKKAKNKTY